MGGSSKKTTVGYWYRPAWHAGLGIGPIDAFLEFRGGDKTAWVGELTASGTISINAPNLWGGEKDQGGIVGDVDVMFGEADQQPNAYLASVFGDQQSAWRGLATLVFKGGKYGAMNPYPQKASYKICKIKKGWDGDHCWYPEKAEIMLLDGFVTMLGAGWEYKVETFLEPNTVWNDFTIPTSGWLQGGEMPFATPGLGGGAYWHSDRSNIWLRRRMHVSAVGLTLNIGADNGCVVWANGVNVGSSNPENVPIPNNQNNPVSFTFSATGAVEIVVKAFAEVNVVDEGGNLVELSFTGMPLVAMNPAHILYYSIIQADMGRESNNSINSASFIAAANWFYANNFGLCTSYDPSAESVEEFQQRICRVAGCSLTRSLIDGLWYLDIANGEYDLVSLPILAEDDILEFEEQPTLPDSTVNSVSVKYFDPVKKETVVTPPVQATALIADFGTNHLTIEYLEIPSASLAARVAQRELLARITPLHGFSLKTTRKPYAWRPSAYFRLMAPKRGIIDMVCILGEKGSGQLRSGAMTISATQDVYSVPLTSFVEVEPGVDTAPDQTPKAITQKRVFEAPYIELAGTLSPADLAVLSDEAGYLMAVAADPDNTRDYTLLTATAGGLFDVAGYGDWCPTALIVEPAGCLETVFTLIGGKLLDFVKVGSAALWDDEIVRVDMIDAGNITLGRGCADTVSRHHAAFSRVWFYDESAIADTAEYTEAETVQAKLLDNTGSAQYPLEFADTISLTFGQRAFRPYPPHQLKVNGESNPALVEYEFDVTWVHRDRLAQADQLIDAGMASIGPEAGTTYTAHFYLNDVLVATEADVAGSSLEAYSLPGDGTVRVELESVRDGVSSWQFAQIEFPYIGSLSISGALPNGTVDVAYSAGLSASGGQSPYVWSLSAGAPPGLTIDAGTGEVSGTPSTAGTYTFDVQVEDTAAETAASSQTVVIDAGWNLAAATYDSMSLALPNSPASGFVQGMAFSPDGTRLYVGKGISSAGYMILQYALSGAWDLTTATYTGKSLTTSANTGAGNGFSISPDGTRMFVFRSSGASPCPLYQYNFGTAWDVGTATYSGKLFNATGINNQSLQWAPDGFSFVYTDYTGAGIAGNLRKVSVGAAWDLTTPSAVQSVPTVIEPTGLAIRPDGKRLWVARYSTSTPAVRVIQEFSMSAPWDLTTLASTGNQFNYGAQESQLQAMAVSADGEKLFIVGYGNTVFRYSV